MNKVLFALLGLVVGLVAGYGVALFLAEPEGGANGGSSEAVSAKAMMQEGPVSLFCDLELDSGQQILGITPSERSRVALAGFDVSKASGWYEGTLAISRSRPGSLTVEGNSIVVKRPALFNRFGTTIKSEEFSIDRTTGRFQQKITIDTGFQIPLIKGTCARLVRAPF
ncbi:MAG: hypothetical protein EBT03_04900 [Betaproteobacteria bacterium]|nr:hypothetical protein [Betaproteobacteria bacterium]NBT75906.1 hypothetical protein [Betaproteobacteria bacterium]NBY14483.1 hypothetical protein [Betaproteobacteria bacterium]NCA16411.1 hypothetical protein [Betaproteobacteria bacterium]